MADFANFDNLDFEGNYLTRVLCSVARWKRKKAMVTDFGTFIKTFEIFDFNWKYYLGQFWLFWADFIVKVKISQGCWMNLLSDFRFELEKNIDFFCHEVDTDFFGIDFACVGENSKI